MAKDGSFGLLAGKLTDVIKETVGPPLSYLVNWGRLYSLWPVHLETACCSVEIGAASGPRFDLERFGVLEAFGSLRQCDFIIVQGTVTRKMAPRLRMIYDQMPEPKYVLAMGACAISGGLYFDSYNVVPGADKVIPVDVHVPGCPPRPEQVIQGIIMVQNKIKKSKLLTPPPKMPQIQIVSDTPTTTTAVVEPTTKVEEQAQP